MISHERPVSVAPMICSSAGIFLMAIGLLSLLPGRDTSRYMSSGEPVRLAQALAQPVASHARVLPSRQTLVACKGRFFHWDADCQLLHHKLERKPLPVYRHSRAEAEKQGYFACDFCERP